MSNNHMPSDEQLKKLINNREIDNIVDDELRAIRWKFWKMRNEVFQDVTGVPDVNLRDKVEQIDAQECDALREYCQRNNISFQVWE